LYFVVGVFVRFSCAASYKKNQCNNNLILMHKKVSCLNANENKTYLLLKLILVKKMRWSFYYFFYDENKNLWEGQGGFGAEKKSK
jgi:hypothetical protein